MVKIACGFAERVLSCTSILFLLIALVAGASQRAMADNVLPQNQAGPVNCNNAQGTLCAFCNNCTKKTQCGVGTGQGMCESSCEATGGACSGCTCQLPSGQSSCGCYQ